MRRLLVLLLMCLIPLQFAWSAGLNLHGHSARDTASAQGMHAHFDQHDHAHGIDAHADGHDHDGNSHQAKNTHHDNHCHPVFTSLLSTIELFVAAPTPNNLIFSFDSSFHSRIPPLFDRPPTLTA